ncbi:MAG: type II secretion system F family protein [Verrucomicrobiales bacterium]|nr:type II secretion system F family protein [Verrucomicrobiales bacterium]
MQTSLLIAGLGYSPPPSSASELIGHYLLVVVLFIGGLALWTALAWLIYFLFSLPLRRRERARLTLDLLQTAFDHGESPERMLASLGKTAGPTLNRKLRTLCQLAAAEAPLNAALKETPGLLSPQMTAMLQAGLDAGELPRVLPACRRLMPDAPAQTLKAYHYLVLLVCGVSPAWILVLTMVAIFVLPKLVMIAEDMGVPHAGTAFLGIAHWFPWLVGIQAFILAGLWLATLLYIVGPAIRRRWRRGWPLPWDRLALLFPWQRARLQRDFSAVLATLLDGGLPEARAVELAALATHNAVLQGAAAKARADLAAGMTLPEALRRFDFTGQFRWRLDNAAHTRGGFERALAGWHESLDAGAFRGEQVAAQLLTSGLVVLNGVFVALLAFTLFQMFVELINAAGTA